jgi:hypothetical protein
MTEEKPKKGRRWEERYRELDTNLAKDGVNAQVRNKVLRRVHALLDSAHAYGTATIAGSAGASLERVISGRTVTA